MKIVIDIPDNIYDAIKSAQTIVSCQRSGKTLLQILVSSVENGTPLPKGHGDLISRQAVITMLQKIENAVEDGDGFQFNEWIEYAKDIPSAEKTALKDIDCEEIGCNCENCKLYLNAKETRGNKPCK